MRDAINRSSQADACPSDFASNERLLAEYRQLLGEAAFCCDCWNIHFSQVADANAPLRLLELLRTAAKTAQPKSNRRRIARLVLKAFHRILDALNTYRQDWSANPTFSNEIRKELRRRLKRIKRARLKDVAAELQAWISEPHLGQDLLWELKQSAIAIDAEHGARSGGAAEILIDEIWASRVAGSLSCERFVSAAPVGFNKVVDTTIARLKPDDVDKRLRSRLRTLVRAPSKKLWWSVAMSMLEGDENVKQLARFRAWCAGRVIGIFKEVLPDDWIDQVGTDKQRIVDFSKAFLHSLKNEREEKPGRPTNPAFQAYANEVNAAYIKLSGKHLTITRPTDKSAPSKRGQTTGFGSEVMTAALQLISPSLGVAEARTVLERLPKK